VTNIGTVESLWPYPIKSMSGEAMTDALWDFPAFMVTDASPRGWPRSLAGSKALFPAIAATLEVRSSEPGVGGQVPPGVIFSLLLTRRFLRAVVVHHRRVEAIAPFQPPRIVEYHILEAQGRFETANLANCLYVLT
jgi:hypothetical protein